MTTLLANLPSIAHAKLPASEDARMALEKCSRLDEFQAWANAPTPWRAGQRAGWDAIQHAERFL